MVRDLFNPKFRNEAKELYDILERRPTTISWKSQLAEECREVAFRLKEPLSKMEEWHMILDYYKIPYPIKLNGKWKKYPDTHNQIDKRRRVNMKKGDRGRGTSIEQAMEENTFIPQLDMGIKDAVVKFLKGKTQSFLSNLVEEKEDGS